MFAATNRGGSLDTAIIRRFDLLLHIDLPSPKQRTSLIQFFISDLPNSLSLSDVEKLAKEMEGYSGADIRRLLRSAAVSCVRDSLELIEARRREEMGSEGEKSGRQGARRKRGRSATSIRPLSLHDCQAALTSCLSLDNTLGALSNTKTT